ncbi:MAG: hypothetical protein GY722_03880 [bacterium]|nr:hypothetical protein [bacterium]
MDEPRTTTPGYRTQSRDTDEWAERIQFDHWRQMETWEKARLVTSLTRSLHRLSLAGLRHRFPDASAEELELRAAYARLGPELFASTGLRLPGTEGELGA